MQEESQSMSHAAYVFDAYGTLFDVHAAVRRHAGDVGPNYQLFSEMWRAKQLEYSWVRTLMGSYRDFWRLTEEALDYTLARFPSVERALRADLLSAYWTLDCYPEVPAVLKELKSRGAKLAILSNGSPAMLEAAVKNAALDVILDDVFAELDADQRARLAALVGGFEQVVVTAAVENDVPEALRARTVRDVAGTIVEDGAHD